MHYTRTTTRGKVVHATKPPCILAGELGHHGYKAVAFYINKKRHRHLVHRLIASAFVAGEADSLTVNHINGIKTDNRPENLEWVTKARNSQLAWEDGLVNLRGDMNPNRKLSEADIPTIMRRLSSGETATAIAAEYGVSCSAIGHVRKGRRWKCVAR